MVHAVWKEKQNSWWSSQQQTNLRYREITTIMHSMGSSNPNQKCAQKKTTNPKWMRRLKVASFRTCCKIQAHACRDQTLEQKVVGMLQTSNSSSYKWGGFAPSDYFCHQRPKLGCTMSFSVMADQGLLELFWLLDMHEKLVRDSDCWHGLDCNNDTSNWKRKWTIKFETKDLSTGLAFCGEYSWRRLTNFVTWYYILQSLLSLRD